MTLDTQEGNVKKVPFSSSYCTCKVLRVIIIVVAAHFYNKTHYTVQFFFTKNAQHMFYLFSVAQPGLYVGSVLLRARSASLLWQSEAEAESFFFVK